MKIISHLILIASLLCCSCISYAQKKHKDNRFGFHFKGKNQNFTKYSFDLHANLIVIKTTIDQSDTLNFILDTGVSSNIITDAKRASSIHNLKYVRQVKIAGAGEGEPLTAKVSIGHTIRIGDITAHNQNLVVLDNDFIQLSEFLGIPIHGIFGHEIFQNFVVKIDFERREIYFYNPKKFRYKKSMGNQYPIVVTKSKPYTDAIKIVSNENIIPMRLVIDTGAGHALLLNAGKDEPIQLPDRVIRANLGRGLNGEINGNIGRIEKIKMGNFEIKNILASFPDSISFSKKFTSDAELRQGSIGCELLRRFIVTFNYNNGYMIMKPIKSRMKESFEHDMSGLDIRAKGAEYNRFVVNNIVEDSPAYKAGLREADEIIFINNQNVRDLIISEIYRILSRKEGKEIEIFYRRNGELRFAYFNLKRII